MNKQEITNEKELHTKAQITKDVINDLHTCTRFRACLEACPVYTQGFTIEQLNEATRKGRDIPFAIKEFTWSCMQCGRCIPVCPVKVRRDVMVRSLKHELREEKPWGYKRYLLIRGPNLTRLPRIIQRVYAAGKKATHRDLARFMEVRPTKPAEVLFYPGCYVYSDETVRQTIRLLDHIGRPYAILGGMTTCCGTPHLLQGEFDRADECMRRLHEDIARVQPSVIITACAECYDAIAKIKAVYKEPYEVLSVVEYLVRHQDQFPRVKVTGDIVVHDSCRFSSTTPAGKAAKQAAATFGTLVTAPSQQQTSCCSHWNHNQDSANKHRRFAYLKEMRAAAPTLACNCLTCYEEFNKLKSDINVIDIIELYIDALDAHPSKENS